MSETITELLSASPGRQWLAHLSDLHLSSLARVRWQQLLNKRVLGYLSWRRKRRYHHRIEVLDSLCRDLAQWPLEQVLMTGDLTHIGLPEEYEEVAAWLASLDFAECTHLVPGNHDAYAGRDWPRVLAHWSGYLSGDDGAGLGYFPSLRVRGRLALIGVSTACPTAPLLATGTVGKKQLEALSGQLQQARERGLFRVVFLHHNPASGEEAWRKRLTDTAALEAVIAARGAELILHGHGHRSSRSVIEGAQGPVPVYAVPSASATGEGGWEAAGYTCYGIAACPGGWQLERISRSYRPQSRDFVTTDRQQVPISRP